MAACRLACSSPASMMRHRCVNDAPINAIDSLRVYDDTLAVPPCQFARESPASCDARVAFHLCARNAQHL
uniref:Uncharacterized protein n=1 Tax=Caenorhabditis japonica TaxID=281687 RepID=A0A8R1IBM8_CAEJA